MSTPSPWEYFSLEELTCHCGCGKMEMNPKYMDKIVTLRKDWFGQSMSVTSGYRCPKHNSNVSKTGKLGPHTTGRALDIRISGPKAFELLQDIGRMGGFYGLGIRQKGSHSGRIIHIDDLTEHDGFPRPRVWTY